MSKDIKKSGVEFEGAQVGARDHGIESRNPLAKEYLTNEVKDLASGDVRVFDLNDEHRLVLNVVDRGLYSGWVTKSDGDIVHKIQPGLVDHVLNNLEAKHLYLAKAPRPAEPVSEPSVSVPAGSNVTVNINIQKSLQELDDLMKAKYIKRTGTKGNYKYTYAQTKNKQSTTSKEKPVSHTVQVSSDPDDARHAEKLSEGPSPVPQDEPPMPVENPKQIATTILQQLGGHRFQLMTGAHSFTSGSKGELSFRIGKNPKGFKAVNVELQPNDTYKMIFFKIGNAPKFKISKDEVTDVYADQLQDIFEEKTGLATTLSARKSDKEDNTLLKKLDNVLDLVKAKYVKREGTKGNYKYTYADKNKPSQKTPAKQPIEKPQSWQDSHGITHMNFAVIEERAKNMTDDGLRFSIKDAQNAMAANPQGHKAGYYQDEVHVYAQELAKRATKAGKTKSGKDIPHETNVAYQDVLEGVTTPSTAMIKFDNSKTFKDWNAQDHMDAASKHQAKLDAMYAKYGDPRNPDPKAGDQWLHNKEATKSRKALNWLIGMHARKAQSMIANEIKVQKAKKDKIPGGLADGKKSSDFDQEALQEGIKVEMEHTSDPKIAEEIAMDHLTEDKDYYKKLKTIEDR